MQSMVISVESMSIVSSLKSDSLRPGSINEKSSFAARHTVSSCVLIASLLSACSQRYACSRMRSMRRAPAMAAMRSIVAGVVDRPCRIKFIMGGKEIVQKVNSLVWLICHALNARKETKKSDTLAPRSGILATMRSLSWPLSFTCLFFCTSSMMRIASLGGCAQPMRSDQRLGRLWQFAEAGDQFFLHIIDCILIAAIGQPLVQLQP